MVWQEGSTRLLDFGVEGEEKARVLFIPSLINRYYILDLKDDRSMVQYLRAQGIRAFVVDWCNPSTAEEGFSLSTIPPNVCCPRWRPCAEIPPPSGGLLHGRVAGAAVAQLPRA